MNPDYINVCLECGNELESFIPRDFSDEEDEIQEPTQEELNQYNLSHPPSERTEEKEIENDENINEDVDINDDNLSNQKQSNLNRKVNDFSDNFYADNAYEQEVLPPNLNGEKSYYSYITSLKDQVKPSENFLSSKLNKKSLIVILVIMIALIAIITPVIAQHQYDSFERTQFNNYAVSALNLELTSNQLFAQITSSNLSDTDKVDQLTNLSSNLNKSIDNIEGFNRFTFNSTRHEFLDLQVEALKISEKNVETYNQVYQIQADYMSDKISDSEALNRINQLPDPSKDLTRFQDIHSRLNDIINNDPIIKSDMNNNRVTPIFQALANNANATNDTINNTNNSTANATN